MIIGIDIDDTISDLSEIFLKYATMYNKEKEINFEIDKTQWELDKAYGWNDNNFFEFSKKYLKKLLNEAKPKKNCVNIIDKLREEGHKIIIITARNNEELSDPYAITEEWLKLNNIKYDKLIVNSSKKEEDCINNKVDVFIDDRLENCESVHKKLNIPVLLFNSVYNTNDNNSLIERVFSWDEVYSKIKNMNFDECCIIEN